MSHQVAPKKDSKTTVSHKHPDKGPDAHVLGQSIIQRAMQVGPANDRYEQEADRVAGQLAQRSMVAPPPAVGAEGGPLDGNTSQETRRAAAQFTVDVGAPDDTCAAITVTCSPHSERTKG